MAESTGILLLNAEDNDLSGLTITEEGSNDLTISSGAALHDSLGYNFAFDGVNDSLYFYKSFTSGSDIYARLYFKLSSGFSLTTATYFYLFRLLDSSGNEIIRPRFGWDGANFRFDRLYWYTNAGQQYTNNSTIISSDTLHYIELHFKSDSSAGETHIYFDGSALLTQTGLSNNNYTASRILVGNNWATGIPISGSEIFIDDIKIDSSYIGAYTESGGALPAIINNYRQQGVM